MSMQPKPHVQERRNLQYDRRERQSDRCRGCGEFCKIRRQCPAFKVKCCHCDRIGHYKEVCEHQMREIQNPNRSGHDFLKHNRIHLDFDEETLFISETGTKNYTAVEMNSGLARTICSITIPPLSQVDIPIRASRVQSKVAILEPLSSLPQQSLAGAKFCISLVNGNKSLMRIMNPTKKGEFLPANSVVASVSLVTSLS
ncbi:unnamed protein product [Mytilus coruscus]|uniref:CCHC-type domain-containing protein n=1 Tax=Mytilus coruscus TaxID=42192 RepID=A0A6J8DMQ9_MYTCO|nr:unnamed protein product [Mytilus coruscus]